MDDSTWYWTGSKRVKADTGEGFRMRTESRFLWQMMSSTRKKPADYGRTPAHDRPSRVAEGRLDISGL